MWGRRAKTKVLDSESLIHMIKDSGKHVKCSMCIMGLGQLLYGQIGKGILYLLAAVLGVYYAVSMGITNLVGFFTLGTKTGDAWLGTVGDNSTVMLLYGIINWIALVLFIKVYIANIKDCYATQVRVRQGKKPIKFKEELKDLLDKKFYKTMLFIPITGVLVFNILPILFMICIAFTNYGGTTVPPALVDWVGGSNFKKLTVLSQFAPTFFKIIAWNILWAVMATVCSYLGGILVALLLNKKCVKGKAFWRAFPILAYATPGFITLLAFKFMFSYGGPINQIITSLGNKPVGFLDIDAHWMARIIGLLVNTWISIPAVMLLATGMLSNMDRNVLEAAEIDGASKWQQFTHITMPFMLFTTMPVLITQFIGNFNNFGIFYFLRSGIRTSGYFLASDTDLLINWLYNLSIDNNYYCTGAAISLILFLITSVISLGIYIKSSSYREEDMYR